MSLSVGGNPVGVDTIWVLIVLTFDASNNSWLELFKMIGHLNVEIMMLSHLTWFQMDMGNHEEGWALLLMSILPNKACRRLSESKLGSKSLCHHFCFLVPIPKDIALHGEFTRHIVSACPVHDSLLCFFIAHVSVIIKGFEIIEPLDIM